MHFEILDWEILKSQVAIRLYLIVFADTPKEISQFPNSQSKIIYLVSLFIISSNASLFCVLVKNL